MSTTLIIALRIVHIVAGMAWAGSLFLMVFFIEPTSRTIGPAAAPFMQEMVGRRKLTRAIVALGTATVVAGALLYWNLVNTLGFSSLLSTGLGLSFTAGAIAAIIGLSIGIVGTRPAANRLAVLGKQVAALDGPPPPELTDEIAATQRRMRLYARSVLVLLILSIIAMAAARYT